MNNNSQLVRKVERWRWARQGLLRKGAEYRYVEADDGGVFDRRAGHTLSDGEVLTVRGVDLWEETI